MKKAVIGKVKGGASEPALQLPNREGAWMKCLFGVCALTTGASRIPPILPQEPPMPVWSVVQPAVSGRARTGHTSAATGQEPLGCPVVLFLFAVFSFLSTTIIYATMQNEMKMILERNGTRTSPESSALPFEFGPHQTQSTEYSCTDDPNQQRGRSWKPGASCMARSIISES